MTTCAVLSRKKCFLASGSDLTASYTYCLLKLSLQQHLHLLLSNNIMYNNVNSSSKIKTDNSNIKTNRCAKVAVTKLLPNKGIMLVFCMSIDSVPKPASCAPCTQEDTHSSTG